MKPLIESQLKKIQTKVLELIKEVDRICNKYKIIYSLAYGSALGAVRHHGFIPWDSDMDIIIAIEDVPFFRECFEKELPENMYLYEWEKEKNYHPCFDRVAFKNLPHEMYHVDVYQLIGLPDKDSEKKKFIIKCYYAYHILSCKFKNTDFSLDRNVWKIKLMKVALTVIPSQYIKDTYIRLQNKYPYKDAKNVYTIASIYRMHDYTNKEDLFTLTRVEFEGIKLPIPKKYDKYLTNIYGDYMTPRRDK